MDDLTATRLCAEAMGLKVSPESNVLGKLTFAHKGRWEPYDPLHDDAQAMALVKRFRLDIEGGYAPPFPVFSYTVWEVEHNDGEQATIHRDADLNRAVVFTVAAMQRAKGAG